MSSAAEVSKTHLVVPLRAVAVASLLVSLASIGTLVIVATLSDTDALSTVALALAILSFVIQIIVYIVQAAAANEQASRAYEVFSRTQQILAQIEERTAVTQQAITAINERVVERLLPKAIDDTVARGTPPSSPEFAINVVDAISSIEWPKKRTPRDEDARLFRTMTTFPEDAGDRQQALRELEALSDDGRKELARFARDELRYRSPSSSLEPGLTLWAVPEELFERDLVERVVDNDRLARLTDHGRQVGRLFTAPEPIPPDLIRLSSIRDSVFP